jgi:hypothetical protein
MRTGSGPLAATDPGPLRRLPVLVPPAPILGKPAALPRRASLRGPRMAPLLTHAHAHARTRTHARTNARTHALTRTRARARIGDGPKHSLALKRAFHG